MEFRFELLLQGHGAIEVVETEGMRLLEALEDRFPQAGPSVGIDLTKRVLEVSFSVDGESLKAASETARWMLSQAADLAGIEATDPIGFAGRPEPAERALAS